jgi:hypothetical protein
MLFLFCAVTVLLFPAGAVWAWRRGGERGLALLTVIGVSALVVLALVAASERGGNRLTQTHGYTYTATRTLLLAGLVLIMPLVASAMSVWAAAPRIRPGFVYPIAAATALIGTVVGSSVAIYTLWSYGSSDLRLTSWAIYGL